MQFSEDGFDLKRDKIVKLEDEMKATLATAGINAEFTGRRRAGAA